MDQASIHYYRAVIFYFIEDSSSNTLYEIYKVLAIAPNHKGAIRLSKNIKKTKPQKANPYTLSEDTKYLLDLLDKNYKHFLIYFISKDETGNYLIPRVYWADIIDILDSSRKIADQVWGHILKRNWDIVYEMYEHELRNIRGDVEVYFLIAYLHCHLKKFAEAEPYLFLLLNFMGVYRLSATYLLLQLPQRKFLSLSECQELFAECSPHEYFFILRMLQKSWDQKAFSKYLRAVEKTPDTFFDVAKIYLEEQDYKSAVKYLRLTYKVSQISFEDIIKEIYPYCQEKEITSFIRWMIKKTKEEKLLSLLAYTFEKQLPYISIMAYDKYVKYSENREKVLLGKATCYYYLNNIEKVETLFSQNAIQSLQVDKIYLQALLLYKKGECENSFAFLNKHMERFPNNKKLQEAFSFLDSISCSNCYYPYKENTCSHCGYHETGYFSFHNDELHWNSKKIWFPESYVLITTPFQNFSIEEDISFLFFSSESQKITLLYFHKEKEYKTTTLLLNKGMTFYKEPPLPPGVYEVSLQEKVLSNTHSFFVYKEQGLLKTELLKINKELNHISFELSITDLLGFEVTVPVSVTILSQSYQVIEEICKTPDDGKIPISLDLSHIESSFLIIKSSIFDKEDTQVLSFTTPFTTKSLEDKIQVLQNDKNLSVKTYRKEHEFLFEFEENFKKAILCIHTPSAKKLKSYRLKDREKGQSFSLEHGKELTTFYFGKTKYYPGRFYQSKGIECLGVILPLEREIYIDFPHKIFPSTQFDVHIIAEKARNIFLIIIKEHDYIVSFSEKFFELFSLLKGLQNRENINTSKRFKCFSHSINQVKYLQVSGKTSIGLNAPKDHGNYRLFCIASDGEFFSEKSFSFTVASDYFIKADFPEMIASEDALECKLEGYAKKKKQLRVYSSGNGIMVDKEVKGYMSQYVPLSLPDTIEITLGNSKRDYHIHALEMATVTHNSVYLLGMKDTWNRGLTKVYTTSVCFAEYITQALLSDEYLTFETMTAKLYCLGTLYQIYAMQKNEEKLHLYAKQIKEVAHTFFSFLHPVDGKWGNYPTYPADKSITAEILHHLSPFLQIPLFDNLHQLAHNTLEAALHWKIRKNRLFGLSHMFEERVRSIEAASWALIHGIHEKKSLVYLKNHCIEEDIPYWSEKNFGGDEKVTAMVAQAYFKYQAAYTKDIINTYFQKRFENGVLSNSASTVAFFDLLLFMKEATGKVSYTDGSSDTKLSGQEIEHDFCVDKGYVWCVQEQPKNSYLLKDCKWVKFSIDFKGKHPLKPGDEFDLHIKFKKQKYPYMKILIASNVAILTKGAVKRGHYIWPIPERRVTLHCKALYKGMGTFYFLLEDRYKQTEMLVDKYPIIVV